MLFKRTLAAGAFVLTSAFAAQAADLTPIMVSAPPPPPPTIAAPMFNWAGPYIGAYGGYAFDYTFWQAGVQAGYNFLMGGFLAGVEAQAGVAFGGGFAFEGDLNARLGYLLGSNLLLYGEGGLGWIGAPIFTAGGGVELGVGPAMSVFAEAKAMGTFGGGFGGVTVQGGMNWHPAY